MPKVFVTQEVLGRDISPAEKFGEIVVLLPPGDFNYSTDFAADRIKEKFTHLVDEDWLLLMGDPVLIALTAALAFEKTSGLLNLLKWDKLKFDYIPISYTDYIKTTEKLR